MADIDDRTLGLGACFSRSYEKLRNPTDRSLGCRKADAHKVARDARQTLERQRQMRTSLAANQGVNLVDYYRLHGGQHAASPVAG